MRNYAPMVDAGQELGQVFAMQPAIEQNAASEAIANAMKVALEQAKINKYNSEAELNQQRLSGTKEGRDLFMQGTTGLNQQQLDQLTTAMQQGWTARADGPPTVDNQYPMVNIEKPGWVTPEVTSRFNQAQAAMGANMAGTGNSNAEQIIKAMQGAVNIGRQDDMIAGKADPTNIASAMAAAAGKPRVDVTGSGIAYNPYGNPNDLNTQAFDRANEVKAKATVDAALSRAKASGNQLPAEAKLVQFYMSLNYPKEQAIEMARSRKNQSLRDLAAELYMDQYTILSKMRSDALDPNSPIAQMTDEEMDRQIQAQVANAIAFLKQKEKDFEATGAPPVNGAQRAPDGNWYIFKEGRYHKVEP